MSGFKSIKFSTDAITQSAAGSLIVANPKILFDGKILGADNTDWLWQNVGTGTFTFTGNKVNMAVTAGQYCIRQSRRPIPYFSGYPLIVEETFDNFNLEANLTKRVGYFSSNAVAPYQTSLDGFWLENDGISYSLQAARSGVSTVNVPFTSWDNYTLLSSYNFNNFTAIYFDFLWLGGAALRIWVCTPDNGWVLGHSAEYIGNNQDTICTSPNQPLRYEIVSTTGSGDFRYICSQASVAGSDIDNNGYGLTSFQSAARNCNTVGTAYALQGFKKNATYRDISVKLENITNNNEASTDTGFLLFLRNPTLSAPLTYAAFDKIDRAIGTTQTVTAFTDDQIIAIVPVGQVSNVVKDNDYKKNFTQTITNTFDEYVLAFIPSTNNQNIRSTVSLKIF